MTMPHANPYSNDLARAHGSYSAYRNNNLVILSDGEKPASELAKFVHGQIRAMILDPRFSCAGAKAAINQGAYRFGLYPRIGSREATAGLCRDLFAFVNEQPMMGSNFTTFIACFTEPLLTDELQFEELLWRQLQGLHDEDICDWDASISSDPEDPRFSFSFAGRAFFVVGLHAGSSRWVRRFAWPTLIFNAHYQFEHLRSVNEFETLQRAIRNKEVGLQGSINPNLANFGEESEARQYSGRAVEKDWKCPFKCKHAGKAGEGLKASPSQPL
jgi:FPC/CPF motif-containing protein YcgG